MHAVRIFVFIRCKYTCTSLETMSSISLQIIEEALTILGPLVAHLKMSSVAMSPMPIQEIVVSNG